MNYSKIYEYIYIRQTLIVSDRGEAFTGLCPKKCDNTVI